MIDFPKLMIRRNWNPSAQMMKAQMKIPNQTALLMKESKQKRRSIKMHSLLLREQEGDHGKP